MRTTMTRRLQEIADALRQEGTVNAKNLAAQYGISMETVRKDLLVLEQMGIARKEHGGASLSPLNVEVELDYRTQHRDSKIEIGHKAVSLLKDCHVLILDAGTTTLASVPFLNRMKSMDIITNSVDIFEQLDGNRHNVFLSGGKKREKNRSMIGHWTEYMLGSIHADVCFLGTSGLLDCAGPTSHSYAEISAKLLMIDRSDAVYVLADNSKFKTAGLHTVATWNKIDGIVTDHGLSPQLYDQFSEQVKVYIAEGIEENGESKENR